MMKHTWVLLLIFSFILFQACHPSVYSNFDSKAPGVIPEIFAKEIFLNDSSYVGYCAFKSDTKEYYYTITDEHWGLSKVLKLSANKKVDTVSFGVNTQWEGEPVFTLDNKRMYFTAIISPNSTQDWHADLFYIEKSDNGWSKPKAFELNSPASEWHVSFTKNNTAYFGSEREGSRLKADIFYSKHENGLYKDAVKLSATINTPYNDCDPLIAPDESYLIFHSDRPGGYGNHDLYITFSKGENTWTKPVNMGKDINTSSWEMGPSLSPDGKYLFFTRREAMFTKEPSKIFWVDMKKIIEKYK